jgi:protein-tyrosine phosphatase
MLNKEKLLGTKKFGAQLSISISFSCVALFNHKFLCNNALVFILASFGCNPIFAGMKILMVCLGNICRSPLAEGILQDKAWKAKLNWRVESAGTNGFHTGEAPHRLSIKVGKQNGIDISQQRSRKFVASDFADYDFLYAMADDVLQEMKRIAGKQFDAAKVDLLMNALHPHENEDVPDPWYGAEDGYHKVYAMMNEACNAIIEKQAR